MQDRNIIYILEAVTVSFYPALFEVFSLFSKNLTVFVPQFVLSGLITATCFTEYHLPLKDFMPFDRRKLVQIERQYIF